MTRGGGRAAVSEDTNPTTGPVGRPSRRDRAVEARTVGVTGGIGAGKTAVLQQLAELGASTVDADAVVHGLYRTDSDVRRAVASRWGAAVTGPGGSINCAAVAERVFADRAELDWLNGLVHPLVKQRIRDSARRCAPFLFCAVPLLFEVGWQDDMWRTVGVWCDAETQRERLAERGWSHEEGRRRTAAQMSMDEKLARSDYGIANSGSRDLLRSQCVCLLARLEEDAARGS